ncbi:MAG: cell division protein FtsA [Elusimicrobiota bacterium]|nr:cell division protein FtsA [Endomicrobiia bacterium]MCX7910490.1 cell division protein FtsA [Endomicrobiia bacterium]MDW8166010.1 cell division protein FtsA [Elusimicrobiota bacterium]
MPKEEIYCGLDIGSGRITGVIARYDPEREIIDILAGKQVIDREAISNGVIKDIERSAFLINEIINSLEEAAHVEKNKLIVGIRGAFVSTYDTTAQIPITSTDKTITKEDQDKVLDHAEKNLRLSNDRKIMTIIPQEYIIDGQPGITNPINMEGSVLEVKAYAVVVYSSFLRNIERTFNEAGYVPDEILYGLIPVSQLVTDNEERKLGCLVIDFNGQTIGVVAYSGGCIRYSREFYNNEIDLGADLITREIAAYYKTSWNIAENIKQQYGVSQPSAIKKDEQIEIPTRDGKSVRITTKKETARIIAEVIESIFLDRIIPELHKVPCIENVLQDGDIVLTGGGANLCGITDAIRELFRSEYSEIESSIDVRPGSIGGESGIIGDEEIISNFSYTTAISLIKYSVSNRQKLLDRRREKDTNFLTKFFKKIWNIFD